jgi:HEAT repeat protein
MTSLILFLALAVAERPGLVSGRLVLLGPASDVAAAVERVGASAWVGYSVPMVSGTHSLCGAGKVVRLDSGRDDSEWTESEMTRSLFVLQRIESGRVIRMRLLSTGCRIDLGSQELLWWEPVSPSDSLRHLGSLARASTIEDVSENAVHAASLHLDSGADALLGDLAGSAPSREVRKKAVFWLGAVRSDAGYRALAARYDSEGDSGLREEVVFALHLSKAEGAVAKLVDIAKRDGDCGVREKALFWLAQRAGAVAARAIANAANEDPDLDVKKQAVFALSQLPEDEGVPLLVEIAEGHQNPEVRKQAFFWLGQAGDPRALDLFEKVLLRK